MSEKEMDCILAVVKYGNFKSAALHLGSSNSAMGMVIQRAENKLGVRLFDRGYSVRYKKPKLTPIGEKVVEQLKVIRQEYYKLYSITN